MFQFSAVIDVPSDMPGTDLAVMPLFGSAGLDNHRDVVR